MKGHINATCPNRRGSGVRIGSRFLDCERCSSALHKTNECPTWWRIYAYLSDAGQSKVLARRKEKRLCKLGEGGEGYIGDDQWCYNCGNSGHLGDDCQEGNQPDYPREPSAFSYFNNCSGPFYDPEKERQEKEGSQRSSRRKESFMDLERVPDDVGRRGKDKAKSRLGKAMQNQAQDNDDGDDWFSKAMRPSDKSGLKKSKPISFSDSLRNSTHHFAHPQPPPAKSSLLDRLGDAVYQPEFNETSEPSQRKKRRSRKRKSSPEHDNGRGRAQEPAAKRHHDQRPSSNWRDRSESDRKNNGTNSHRPRYRGGYS
ncbi:hypothetical protein FA15DRAFT_664810 [Coprinopsis marcescibilis]|uniref:CCHC-type domain-containing protein n=1 Tax=Coprinopsis marcescibilis TaxID=230819 RepID=A0A5C3LJH7_COPMA|nr:hypothetical protein FA15DRAFT_664810 [Coprinopsis marcescibilis]